MAKTKAKKTPEKVPVEKDEDVVEVKFTSFAVPLAILLSAVIISVSVVYAGSKLTTEGTTLGVNEDAENNADAGESGETPAGSDALGAVLGQFETFTEYDEDICKEDGKPVVYLFSTTWCPHCEWIKDTFDSWAKDNSDKISAYHWELDTMDNSLTDAVESEVPEDANAVYEAFNPEGSIPTFVFGCKYGRVGNGYEAEDDLDKEAETFDNVLEQIL